MFLSRFDALLLHKVLFHYEKIVNSDESFGDVLDEISALNEKLEEYLLNEPGQAVSASVQDKVGDCTSDDDEDYEDEDEDEDDEEGEDEKSQEPPPEASVLVSAAVLHDLPPVETEQGLLEFEQEDDEINVLVNGDFYGDHVASFLKRSGKIVEVWLTSNEKFVFELKKSNKEWKKVFVEGLVHKVVND